jgi:hypothetical protein
MSIAAEFKSRGIVRGGILILGPHEALAMVARAREQSVPVLGVDGFWITEQTTQPDMEHSIDLGGAQSSWRRAEEFIRTRADSDLMFEVVADEDTADLWDVDA